MRVIKPIPDDILHTFPDEGLTHLLGVYRKIADSSSDELAIAYINARVEDIYKVMGYRCALQYRDEQPE